MADPEIRVQLALDGEAPLPDPTVVNVRVRKTLACRLALLVGPHWPWLGLFIIDHFEPATAAKA